MIGYSRFSITPIILTRTNVIIKKINRRAWHHIIFYCQLCRAGVIGGVLLYKISCSTASQMNVDVHVGGHS